MHRSFHITTIKFAAGAVIGLLASCAQIVAPTGGNKDFTAPKVAEVSPQNKTINFNKKKIVVEFDEFIQLNTPEDLIVISPPLEVKPTYANKGRALEIKFNSPLQENTTYTINFSTAVGDNKENNLLKDYNYVFSTGPQLDSGYVSGNLVNSFTNKPEKDVTVALYYTDSFTDSTVIKEKPVYLSKTSDNGDFRISNLPITPFRIIAFKDENRNLKVDRTEEIAFTENIIKPGDSSTAFYNLKLFKPSAFNPNHIIDTFNREPDKFVVSIYNPESVSIKNTNGKQIYVKQLKGNITDTFYVFTKTNPNDTAVNFIINNKPVAIRYKPIFKTEKLTYNFNKQPELNDTIVLHLNNPITGVDTSRIRLFKDSTQLNANRWLANPFEYRISYNWAEKTNYKLEIGDSAFTDLFNQKNKKDRSIFTTKTMKDYATLLLHVKLAEAVKSPVILQITDDTETKTFYQFFITRSQDINLEYVLPGNYKLKYIFDTNNNNKWDNGDFKLKTQPEKVGYFKETINIKAYWDLEQSILIE